MTTDPRKQLSGWKGGEVVVTGGTDWSLLGRVTGGKKKSDQERLDELLRAERYPNLSTPHRLKSLMGVRIKFVAAGPSACHSIIGDMDGNCYTWGRNERGQLGHGDKLQRNVPTIVPGLNGKVAVGGSGGKHHSVVVTSTGDSYAFGSNLQGQCGTGTVKSSPKNEELLLSPTKALVSECTSAACGAEFTMWLCSGKLYSAGMPQYGQLGHGTDHEYNAKDSSVKIMYQPQPTPALIKALADVTVTSVACGTNHTLALDNAGAAYTWGNGGYGRLGHSVQQDEFKPRQLDTFRGRILVSPHSIAACGTTSSFCNGTGEQLFAWGKLKTSGDNTMYPKPYMDLAGWQIRHMACGAYTFAVAAHYMSEQSTITWGQAQHAELGYGPTGKKSSASPDKCNALEGIYTDQVACGTGHMLFLVDPEDERVAKLERSSSGVAEEQCEQEHLFYKLSKFFKVFNRKGSATFAASSLSHGHAVGRQSGGRQSGASHNRVAGRARVAKMTLAAAGEACSSPSAGVPSWRVTLGHLAAGATAGAAVEAALYPLDTIKTRLQLMTSGGGLRALLSAGGGKALYAGVWGNLAGAAPASALFMAVYEPTKRGILARVPEDRQFLGFLGAGAAAGLVASFVRVPTEVVKQRMQSGEFSRAGMAVRGILAQEGVRGLFAGYGSFLLRDLPFDAINFMAYEQLKKAYTATLVDRPPNSLETSVMGGLAGAFTGVATTPLDVMKTRLMTQGTNRVYTGVYDCATKILAEEGAGAFFKGWEPRVVWITLGGCVFFTALEEAKKLFAPKAAIKPT
ncbi:hypothetical protein WJX72_007117 [[Myrmecia] bisecta]|uniref:Uncharacterized protein n=1 Tax=[Myrmecia] bisecta TaxID=41462 RepID=A0AAW1Q858_9CHLO